MIRQGTGNKTVGQTPRSRFTLPPHWRGMGGRAPRRRTLIGGLGIAMLVTPLIAPSRPLLVWNASASAPIGLYSVRSPARPARGDMVIAWAPRAARRLAARRHYLPANVPLVKRVAALPGDEICATGAVLRVRGRIAARRLRRDARGRVMRWWRGCGRLAPGMVLLINPARASFDGRYFGPVPMENLIGKATPVWLR
jgi:conjugative transfer signal peptidase TraF